MVILPAKRSPMALLLLSLLLLALTGPSSGVTYCVCKDGVGDQALQKALDYACGAGADCTPIQQNGACYQPNTVKGHCDYAVNSYFQRHGQVTGSCEFAGTATTSATPPSGQTTTCVYPSTASTTTTPSTSTTPTTTPATSTTPPTSTTPSTGTSTTTPSTTPTTTTTTTPTAMPSVYNSGTGLGPTGITDSANLLACPSWVTSALTLLLLPLFYLLCA